MKKLVLNIALLFVFANIGFSGYAQDSHFTQFYSSPLFLAPSYAGGVAGYRTVANYRNQWSMIPDAYQTYSVSWDHNIQAFKSGVGFVAIRDVAGAGNLGNTRIGALYSYDVVPYPDVHIRPGIGFYVQQISLDFNSLIFSNQLTSDATDDGASAPGGVVAGKPNVWDIDVSSSLLVYADNMWLGATWDHMLRPTNTFYGDDNCRTEYKISIYGGYRYILKGFLLSKIEESVSLLFNFRTQGLYRQLDLGTYWYRTPLTIGVWWRGLFKGDVDSRVDALALMVGYKFQNFSVGYSYDFTVSSLGLGSGGSHELSLIYEFNVTTRKRWKSIPCPTF